MRQLFAAVTRQQDAAIERQQVDACVNSMNTQKQHLNAAVSFLLFEFVSLLASDDDFILYRYGTHSVNTVLDGYDHDHRVLRWKNYNGC